MLTYIPRGFLGSYGNKNVYSASTSSLYFKLTFEIIYTTSFYHPRGRRVRMVVWLILRTQMLGLIWFRLKVFNITFNNISVISWWSVLLVEETGVPGENTVLPQITGKLYHIFLYRVHFVWSLLVCILPQQKWHVFPSGAGKPHKNERGYSIIFRAQLGYKQVFSFLK
jgi:hypothetical protein